jgi:hypothetical protein
VEPLKRHRASTYGFSESVSIISANEFRGGVGLPAGGVPSRGLECSERLTKPVAGPTGREIGAQGFGHRPMPWVTGDRSTPRPEGPRENLFETAPLPGEGSRGPSGRMIVAARWVPGNRPAASSLGSVLPARWAGKDGRQQHHFKLARESRGEGRARLCGPAPIASRGQSSSGSAAIRSRVSAALTTVSEASTMVTAPSPW